MYRLICQKLVHFFCPNGFDEHLFSSVYSTWDVYFWYHATTLKYAKNDGWTDFVSLLDVEFNLVKVWGGNSISDSQVEMKKFFDLRNRWGVPIQYHCAVKKLLQLWWVLHMGYSSLNCALLFDNPYIQKTNIH